MAGTAAPGANIILEIDGKSAQMGDVGTSGEFLLNLDKPMANGKHLLKLKSVGPQNKGPIVSDHSIEVVVASDRETVVALLAEGKPRLILQGVDENAQGDAGASNAKDSVPPAAPEMAPKTADAKTSSKPDVEMVQKADDRLADQKTAQVKSEKPPAADPKKTPEWRELTFGDMKYVALDDKSGEVSIEGMAQSDAKLRFLMDGKSIGETVAGKTGSWSLTAKQKLAPGAHWLVAEQIDAKGEVVVKAESPFDIAEEPAKTVAKQAPEAPVSPASPTKNALEMIKDATSGDQKMAEMVAPKTDKPRVEATKNSDLQKPESAEATGTAVVADNAAKSDTAATPGTPAASDKADAQGNAGNQDKAATSDKADGSTNLWDKFTDIFKVDPNEKDAASENATGEPGEQMQDNAAKASSQSFAFGSVNFIEEVGGGAIEMTGQAEPGSRIRLFKGVQEIGEVVADDKGSWTFIDRSKIASGTHLFRAGHVLKNGRIASEARMQYDHIALTKMAKAPGKNRGRGAGEMAKADVMAEKADVGEGMPKASALDPERSIAAGDERKTAQPAKRSKYAKRGTKRWYRAIARWKKREKKKRQARRWKRKMRALAKRQGRKSKLKRYSLGRKNKARYLAKRRKLYPRSRRSPTKVRVVKGTTLWGYSKHYYGRGDLYPRIHRANRRTIGNPNRIYSGQKIKVPGKRKKRRKSR